MLGEDRRVGRLELERAQEHQGSDSHQRTGWGPHQVPVTPDCPGSTVSCRGYPCWGSEYKKERLVLKTGTIDTTRECGFRPRGGGGLGTMTVQCFCIHEAHNPLNETAQTALVSDIQVLMRVRQQTPQRKSSRANTTHSTARQAGSGTTFLLLNRKPPHYSL